MEELYEKRCPQCLPVRYDAFIPEWCENHKEPMNPKCCENGHCYGGKWPEGCYGKGNCDHCAKGYTHQPNDPPVIDKELSGGVVIDRELAGYLEKESSLSPDKGWEERFDKLMKRIQAGPRHVSPDGRWSWTSDIEDFEGGESYVDTTLKTFIRSEIKKAQLDQWEKDYKAVCDSEAGSLEGLEAVKPDVK